MMKLTLMLAGLVAATALQAAPVYNNTTTDTFDTVVYSTGVYSEIGDRIQLAGTDRSASGATAQFYNLGSGGNFDATLRLFGLASNNVDVGSLLGSYTAAGMAIAAGGSLDVSWSLASLNLPDELFFTVSVDNFSSGIDLGLTVFDPPTVGLSSNQFLIVKGAGGYAQATQGNGQDNIYFRLDATSASSVPEPGSAVLMLLALLPLVVITGRRAQSR